MRTATFQSISPADAFAMLGHGAILVDIREADERRRESIPTARHHALSRIDRDPPQGGQPVIFHCRGGARVTANAARLAALVPGAPLYALEGGLEAWRAAGLPVEKDARQPIEIMRQVQIAAGALVALGTALGALVDAAFLVIPGFVGAGLVFAGATGFCGMARLLALAPWNRAPIAKVKSPPRLEPL